MQQLWVREKTGFSAPNAPADGFWLFYRMKELVIFVPPEPCAGNGKRNSKRKGPICSFAALRGGADPLCVTDAHEEATRDC